MNINKYKPLKISAKKRVKKADEQGQNGNILL
jgi:hypothetical protein